MLNRTTRPAAELQVVAVIVVYEQALDEVESWPVLRSWLEGSKTADGSLVGIVVYDNSARPRASASGEFEGCTYAHDGNNGGTAAAYACAAKVAGKSGAEWLLLLDQDTKVTDAFLSCMFAELRACRGDLPGALVARVLHGKVLVSPAVVGRGGAIRPLAGKARDLGQGYLTAIASGSVLNVEAFQSLLPFPSGLWLDYVDHWILRRMQTCGFRVVVVDCELQHDLSIVNPAGISRRRLASILDGEREFHRLLGVQARAAYPFRILGRIMRYLVTQPQLAAYTVAWAFGSKRPSGA